MRPFLRFAAVLAALSSASTAAAQVTTVKVPTTVIVGVPAKVRVEGGRNPCGAVMINFGAGRDPITYPLSNGLPFEVDHTWQGAGQFRVTATGQGNCTGSATTTVEVVVFKPIAPVPTITGYFGWAKPGAVAGIVGKAFGTSVGTVTATLKRFNGETLTVDLEVLQEQGQSEWHPALIGVRWPDISGVREQNATVRVKAGDRFSNAWTVAFVPELEFKVLPQADVKVVSCSLDANDNVCNHVIDQNPCAYISPDVVPWPEPDVAFRGIHANCLGAVGDDSGTDIYEITLKNGWVLESFDFDRDVSGNDGDYVKTPTPAFPRGAATWKASVQWLASSDDEIEYFGRVGITGPKGIPHK